MTLVVVCGLKAEADIAAGDGITVIAGGGDLEQLSAALEAAAPSAEGLLSFGVAGGLDPALRPGDVRVASASCGGTSGNADSAWAAALSAALGVPTAPFASADAPVADVTRKSALYAATGAATVDMETHVVARCAMRHGLRWAGIRAVTDPAGRALPHAATVGMRGDGKVDLAAILVSLARDPRQLPGLVRTGLDARAAFASLFRCRQRLGPRFALLDLGEPGLHVP